MVSVHHQAIRSCGRVYWNRFGSNHSYTLVSNPGNFVLVCIRPSKQLCPSHSRIVVLAPPSSSQQHRYAVSIRFHVECQQNGAYSAIITLSVRRQKVCDCLQGFQSCRAAQLFLSLLCCTLTWAVRPCRTSDGVKIGTNRERLA